LESSLWELTALRHHADPTVSSYTAVLDRDLSDRRKTAELNLAEVIAGSYSSMFDHEVGRRLKQIPVAGYAIPPSSLFGTQDTVDFPGWLF
jgi:U3 small nucleolar RNA-associated protein 19